MKKLIILFLFITFCTQTFAQDKSQQKAKPEIYNPKADAQADINAAVAKAKKEGKHVFLQVGGNWCGWCILFHDMVDATPEVKKYLDENYETVLVNYSQDNKNEAVLAKLNYPQRFGFPVFVILDGDGKVIHTQNSAYLESSGKDENGKAKNGHDVKVVLAFLKNWSPEALDPKSYK